MASIFEEFIHRNSQEQAAQPLDPNQLQVGQNVYDQTTQEEYTVVEDDPSTTHKVLMPAGQQGTPVSGVPEGVKSVEDSELATSYGVQPATQATGPVVARRAQEDIDWDDIASSVTDLIAFTRQRDFHGATSSIEELTNIVLSHIEMPEDTDFGPMFGKAKRSRKRSHKVLPEFIKRY